MNIAEVINEIDQLKDDLTKLQNGLKDASEFCLGLIDAADKAKTFLEKLKSRPLLLKIIDKL